MQQQIRTMESDQEESNHRGSQERLLMLQTYLAVLPRLRDCPSVYNQLGAHITIIGVAGRFINWTNIVCIMFPTDDCFQQI